MDPSGKDSVGSVVDQLAEFDDGITLRSGAKLKSWRLAYETYGTLNADRSNVVLVCHALSGGQHAAGHRESNPKDVGWWDNMIGPGKPIDTEKFFVVSPNNLGGCHGSTGPNMVNPDTKELYGSGFPMVTVDDWVESQKRLLERLEIPGLFAVVGGSLGGMQGLRWAQLYPDFVRHVVAIAVTARLTAQNIAFNDIARQSIMRDPLYRDGPGNDKIVNGLAVARMLAHVTYISGDLMSKKFGRERRSGDGPGYTFDIEYEVESYLRHQGEKFAKTFDPDTYLLMTKALDYFDLAVDFDGDLDRAVAGIRSGILLVSFKSDWRFSPEMVRELLRSLLLNRINVSYAEIGTQQGHDSFLLADEQYHRTVKTYLENAWLRSRR